MALLVGAFHLMQKCLVLVGFMRMLSMGSAVCSRNIAFCAPSVDREKTNVSSTNCVGGC